MLVLVSDTSVLFDLERGGLLEAAFALPYEFAVPDLLYKRELHNYNGPALRALGLRVEELDGDGVALALTYREQAPPLSLPDAFALSLAKTSGATLLSSSGSLNRCMRGQCAQHGIYTPASPPLAIIPAAACQGAISPAFWRRSPPRSTSEEQNGQATWRYIL